MDDQGTHREADHANAQYKRGCLSVVIGQLAGGGVLTFIVAIPVGAWVALAYQGGWWVFGLVAGALAGTGAALFGTAVVLQKLSGGPSIRLF